MNRCIQTVLTPDGKQFIARTTDLHWKGADVAC